MTSRYVQFEGVLIQEEVDVELSVRDIAEALSDAQFAELVALRESSSGPSDAPDLPPLDEFAELVRRVADFEGVDWVNRWLGLCGYALEKKEAR